MDRIFVFQAAILTPLQWLPIVLWKAHDCSVRAGSLFTSFTSSPEAQSVSSTGLRWSKDSICTASTSEIWASPNVCSVLILGLRWRTRQPAHRSVCDRKSRRFCIFRLIEIGRLLLVSRNTLTVFHGPDTVFVQQQPDRSWGFVVCCNWQTSPELGKAKPVGCVFQKKTNVKDKINQSDLL